MKRMNPQLREACIPMPVVALEQLEWSCLEELKNKLNKMISVLAFDSQETPPLYKVSHTDLNLANNQTTAADILDHLSASDDVAVLEAIAANANTANSTLQRLSKHSNPRVRAAICENRFAPFELLNYLCSDRHPDVRFGLAENPYVPKTVLEQLIGDENPYVASRAETTLKRLQCERNNNVLFF
ncbi:MAG: hypothetical protein K2W82_05540 [Candidatus Obscuribacterales bacterium]|nr:hypothetical protein [Candidatus Obscuribacterales bacterium]